MPLIDQVCETCQQPFQTTAAEVEYYDMRGLAPPPNCPTCRARIRAERHAELVSTQAGPGERTLGTYGGITPGPGRQIDASQRFTVPCTDCGAPASVPFQPQRGRPIYCRRCFNRRRASA